MEVREGLLYSKEHEWVKVEGDIATVGITDYAQESLGDVVFVELPEVGRVVSAGEATAVVESVKSASDVYSPVSGEVIEINQAISDSPELVNKSPYDEGWFFKVKMSNQEELSSLLSPEAYKEYVAGL